MPQLKVLVVGASIAGPATAYWLARAGAHITIIERFPELRTGGQGIDIRTAGVAVMRKMPGMEAAVRAKTTTIQGLSFVRDDGRPYGTLVSTGNPDQQSLISEYEIFRGDLSRILFDMTTHHENIEYVFGEQVVSMRQSGEQDDGPLTVEFANGYPMSEYDLVVACDGATSRTRAMGLGCSSVRDHVISSNSWAAYFSIERDLLDGAKVGLAYNAPGGRFLALGPDPAGATRVGMITIKPSRVDDAALPLREAMKQGDASLKAYLAKQYEGIGWRSKEIIEGMMASDDLYASEIVQVKVPSLHKGRFVMVGDAGYGPGFTGGGTTLALAGSYLLAGEICTHKGDLKAGLEAYETRMRPIIDDLQKVPPFIFTFLAPQTAWGIWVRNHVFAFITWTRVLSFVERFFAGAFAHTDKYRIPDYEWVS